MLKPSQRPGAGPEQPRQQQGRGRPRNRRRPRPPRQCPISSTSMDTMLAKNTSDAAMANGAMIAAPISATIHQPATCALMPVRAHQPAGEAPHRQHDHQRPAAHPGGQPERAGMTARRQPGRIRPGMDDNQPRQRQALRCSTTPSTVRPSGSISNRSSRKLVQVAAISGSCHCIDLCKPMAPRQKGSVYVNMWLCLERTTAV